MDRPVVILLVDDDEGDRLMMQEALTSVAARREIHVATDGQEAWEFLTRVDPHQGAPRPDVIFLDLNMPRMDGRELLKLLKNDPALSTIPTVVFTTSSAQEDVVASYQSYANAYVVKPVDLDGMTAAVRGIDEFFTRVSRLTART